MSSTTHLKFASFFSHTDLPSYKSPINSIKITTTHTIPYHHPSLLHTTYTPIHSTLIFPFFFGTHMHHTLSWHLLPLLHTTNQPKKKLHTKYTHILYRDHGIHTTTYYYILLLYLLSLLSFRCYTLFFWYTHLTHIQPVCLVACIENTLFNVGDYCLWCWSCLFCVCECPRSNEYVVYS